MHPIWIGSLGSLIAGLATGLGALPALFVPSISDRAQGILLGFGGGVMLAATSFSLLVPGTEAALELGYSQFIAALIMVAGMLIGALFLESAHRFFPHEHFFKGVEGDNRTHLKRIWLFIIAITLHNFPEGLAVGVGFATGQITEGLALAIGIGLQNIPEGLVVALSLVAQGYRRLFAFQVALLTGLVEPIGGMIGATVVSLVQPLLPWGMAFAAGAMLFVISDEILPESHRQGIEREATFGVLSGFVVMLLLDIALG
ncbi:MAG: ZIP family metal transporter [Thermostichus sp. DG02_5_bins_236]